MIYSCEAADLECFHEIHKLKRKNDEILAKALRLMTSSSFQVFLNKRPVLLSCRRFNIKTDKRLWCSVWIRKGTPKSSSLCALNPQGWSWDTYRLLRFHKTPLEIYSPYISLWNLELKGTICFITAIWLEKWDKSGWPGQHGGRWKRGEEG